MMIATCHAVLLHAVVTRHCCSVFSNHLPSIASFFSPVCVPLLFPPLIPSPPRPLFRIVSFCHDRIYRLRGVQMHASSQAIANEKDGVIVSWIHDPSNDIYYQLVRNKICTQHENNLKLSLHFQRKNNPIPQSSGEELGRHENGWKSVLNVWQKEKKKRSILRNALIISLRLRARGSAKGDGISMKPGLELSYFVVQRRFRDGGRVSL